MKNSKIEWTDHTFNPWIGCTKVSPGCANCYAEAMDHRWGNDSWGPGKPRRRTSAANWKQPIKLDREFEHESTYDATLRGTKSERVRPRVFCASLADWLDDEVPIEWTADLLRLIKQTQNLDWLLLSKRLQNWLDRMRSVDVSAGYCGITSMVGKWIGGQPPANVWIGTTVEDQQRADERIPHLLRIPAKVRFLSCEPLLSEVELEPVYLGGYESCAGHYPKQIHWVICGGESGPKARPMDLSWARSLKDQCASAGVPFFMKQLGGVRDKRHDLADLPEDLRIREFPTP